MKRNKISTEAPKIPEPLPGQITTLCVIAKHFAKPERVNELETRMISMAKTTRTEPGALAFHLHRDRFDPNLLVIYEIWSDTVALQAHFKQPHVQEWLKDSPDYLEKDLEVEWLIMLEEQNSVWKL